MESTRFFGLYRGKVAENNDPDKHGRLRIVVPQLFGTEPTNWAWPQDASYVKSQVPAVGQGVWVMFEGGDPYYPIWTGTFGKTISSYGPLVVKPSPAITGHLVAGTSTDGTRGLDLMATLVHMSQKLEELESRIAALE